MTDSLGERYRDFYRTKQLTNAYPAEFLVRIFLGNYPSLNLDKTVYSQQRLIEVGCGDGRNLILFSRLGFETHGIEIDDGISEVVRSNLRDIGVNASIRTGCNIDIPYEHEFFDYMVSWNSSYYMGEAEHYHSWESYVKEFARIIKPSGSLILSIPKHTSFIYEGAVELRPGYKLIVNDPYKIRNGHVFRCFLSEEELINSLSGSFSNFRVGSIDDDCFGQNNRWHLIVCNRK
jgi:SAM-dependent methyltransferase